MSLLQFRFQTRTTKLEQEDQNILINEPICYVVGCKRTSAREEEGHLGSELVSSWYKYMRVYYTYICQSVAESNTNLIALLLWCIFQSNCYMIRSQNNYSVVVAVILISRCALTWIYKNERRTNKQKNGQIPSKFWTTWGFYLNRRR